MSSDPQASGTTPGGRAQGDVPRDSGLQPERTSLAWRRTVLAVLIVDLFIFRDWVSATLTPEAVPAPASAAAAGAAALSTAVVACAAFLRARHLRAGEGAPRRLATGAVSGAVLLLGCAVLTTVLAT